MPRKSTMKKSNDNILSCLVWATIKQIIIILQLIILLQLAMNFVYKATDRQKIVNNISIDQECFKEIYDIALYNDVQRFKTLQAQVEYNGDILCLQIAKDSDNWLKQEYRKADKVWLDAIDKSDDGVQAMLAGWKFMEPITGLSTPDINIVEVSEQRYWNGVELILKTLLSIVNFKTTIAILLILEWLLFIMLLYRVYKLLKLREIEYNIVYLIQIACVFIGTNQFLIYNWPTRLMVPTITMIAQHLMLQIYNKYSVDSSIDSCRDKVLSSTIILYAVTGSIICYFDYIYSPLLQLFTLLVIEYAIIDRSYDIQIKDNILIKLYKSFVWLCGYFGTWIIKFVIVYLQDKSLTAEIQGRTNQWNVQASEKVQHLMEYFINQLKFVQIALLVMALLLVFVAYKIDLNLKEFIEVLKRQTGSTVVTMLIVFAVWNVVFAYHTYWHVHFTFGLIQYPAYLIVLNLIYYAQNFKNCSNSDEQKSNDVKNNRGVSDVELEI